MNKTYLQVLLIVSMITVGLLFFLTPDDNLESRNGAVEQSIDVKDMNSVDSDIDTQTTSEPNDNSPQSAQQEKSNTTFYSASKSCSAEVSELIRAYPMGRELFDLIRKHGKAKFSAEAGVSRDVEAAAINQLYVLNEPSYVDDVLNRNSPDFKPPELNLETALRDNSVNLPNMEFLNAIKNNQFSLAESLIRELVAQAPDKILKVPQQSRSALQLALTNKSRETQGEQVSQAMKDVIDVFIAAGYKIHFFEIVNLSLYLLHDRLDVLEHLINNFSGNLSTVFDEKYSKSSNLVLYALQYSTFELAAFWLKNGVDPFSNIHTIHKLQWSISLPEPGAPSSTTEAFKTLLNAGLITTRADKRFEEKLSAWLPKGNAAEYYEQHQRLSNLGTGQDKRLQADLAELAQAVVLEHTGGTIALSAGCEDEFLAAFRSMQKRMREHALKETDKSRYDELAKQASTIYEEYLNGLIDASLAIEQLALLDEYRAKNMLSSINGRTARTNRAGKQKQKTNAVKPDMQPDMTLIERLRAAILSRDYAQALEIADSVPPYYADKAKQSILNYALSKNETSEVFRLLFENMNVPVFDVLSAVMASSDTQLLEAISEAGFDINAVDGFNRTLLTRAVNDKHTKVMSKLISLGVDIEYPYVGLDALDIALVDIVKGQQNFYFVQELLGANKRIEDSHRQLLSDLLKMYPGPTQRVIDKYAIVL